MKWVEVSIYTSNAASDVLSEICTELGASGVALEDGQEIAEMVKNSQVSDYIDDSVIVNLPEGVIIKAYYPDDENSDSLISVIKDKIKLVSGYFDTGRSEVKSLVIDEEDWASNWKKYYKPFRITESITIKPTWEHYEGAENEKVIEIDPGMAFGTGTHETTILCAKLIEKYLTAGDAAADIGTGSGILALIMAKSGASFVEAVDTDNVAVKVANENVILNGLQDEVFVKLGSTEDLEKRKYKLIAANIIADVIIGMADRIPEYLEDAGYFIASGIIKTRKEDVERNLEKSGFKVLETLTMNEWVGMCFKWQGSM